MPKRRILFKVAILAAIVLGLVPASVLASVSTRVLGADAEMEFAAQSGTGVAVTRAPGIDGEGDVATTGHDLDATGGQQYGLADGLQVLYTFREGSGTTVHDVSGVGVPLDLEMSDGSAVTWVPGGGLAIDSATLIASAGPATKVISACQGSNEITIDAWVRPANTTQDGPARIVTLSRDAYNRNFTLGQGLWGTLPSALYDVRLRTTATDDSGEPSLSTPDGSLTTELTHVVYTRDASGQARIYIDDVEQASGTVGGDFSNWDGGFRLALANELTGGRPWLGEFHLVAIYSRALSPSIAIEKVADPTMIVASDPVTYTYTVTNQGGDPLSDVAVSDDRCSPVSDPAEISGNGDDVLDLGEVWVYTCTMTLDQDTTNIATVTATDPLSQTVGNSDAAFVDVIHPGIAIAKLPDTQVVVGGTEAVFTITVTNTGDVTLDNVTVADVLASGCDADLGSLDVQDSETYTCTAAGVEADFTNTATVTGEPPVGDDVSASDSADVTVVYPDLSITKTVNWNGVTPDESQEFEICIAGPSYPGGDCQTAGYDGGVLYWYDLTPGDYTVTETDPGSAWDVTITGSPATVSAGDVSASARVTNTRKLGRLEVTKTVDWNGVPADVNQTFEICITGPSYPGGDCRTVGSSGGTLSWGDLVPGDYTVTETDPGSAWDVTFTGSPATVPDDGGTAAAGVTNTRKRGRLEVTKTVDWNGVTPDPTQVFTICIEGPSYPSGDGCQEVGSSGGTLSWGDLIPGDYTVAETDPGSAWNVAITGSPATVPDDGGSASAGVTNARKLGSLEVTKTVDWKGVTPDPNQTFTICIEGPSYPSGDGCQVVGYSGGTLFWDDLVPGVYTVTETSPDNLWRVTITGSPATVPDDGGSAGAGVTNTRKLGSLEVVKAVNWSGVTPDESQQFEICIEGPSYLGGDCQTVGYGGGALSWEGLIPGVYTVTETNPGSMWDVMITGSPATISANGGSAGVEVTNARKLGGLSVTKTVDWGEIAPDGSRTFTICIKGPSYTAGDCQTVGYTGGTLSWDALVPGLYTVTEVSPGRSWDVTITGSPATVPEDGGRASASVFNQNGGGLIYLPLVLNSYAIAPDLVVEHIAVTSDSAQVVIKNQGNAPVSSNDPFWVDLYVDPDPVPTGVNQTWGSLCGQGIAWGVESPALPLEPGGTITLTIGDAYYWAEYSNFPGSLPAGTPIYVQVDSADVQTTYGAVLESHEIMGDAYNNVGGPVFSTLLAQDLAEAEPPALGDPPSASFRRLPPRP
jgi:uncharacterized repeat protein (TIGR01451 family)